jgi:hypothetical protein
LAQVDEGGYALVLRKTVPGRQQEKIGIDAKEPPFSALPDHQHIPNTTPEQILDLEGKCSLGCAAQAGSNSTDQIKNRAMVEGRRKSRARAH